MFQMPSSLIRHSVTDVLRMSLPRPRRSETTVETEIDPVAKKTKSASVSKVKYDLPTPWLRLP